MKEIVVNNCYGCFLISEKAVNWMREHGAVNPTSVPERDDPLLIRCIRELGKEANADYSNLTIIQYDDTKYRLEDINDNDGIETPVFVPVIKENELASFVEGHDSPGLISYLTERGIKIDKVPENIRGEALDEKNIKEPVKSESDIGYSVKPVKNGKKDFLEIDIVLDKKQAEEIYGNIRASEIAEENYEYEDALDYLNEAMDGLVEQSYEFSKTLNQFVKNKLPVRDIEEKAEPKQSKISRDDEER